MKDRTNIYDFKALGEAIKRAREANGLTREQVGSKLNIAPRYLLSIENDGQHPSLQVFYELVTLFDISVDQFFFPHKATEKTTRRRQLDSQIDELEETDLIIVSSTAKGIKEAKGMGE